MRVQLHMKLQRLFEGRCEKVFVEFPMLSSVEERIEAEKTIQNC